MIKGAVSYFTHMLLRITNLKALGQRSELYIFDIWNDNLQSFNREKNEASVPVFYADWTSVPVPQTSSLRGLDVGFHSPSAKGVALYGE